MNPADQPRLGEYARAIETMWTELLGRPAVLSRRDWDLISSWFGRSIPLQLVREALQPAGPESGGGSRRAKQPPRSLSYVASVVEEAWTVVLSGRIPAQSAGVTDHDTHAATLARWRDRQSAERIGSPLHTLLSELLDRLASGDSARELDQILENRLIEVAPGPILLEIERKVDVELSEFRGKMPSPALERTKAQAILNRLRSELDLPKLPCSP